MGSLWKGVYWSSSAAWRKFGDRIIASDIVSNYSINRVPVCTSTLQSLCGAVNSISMLYHSSLHFS